MPLLHDNLVSVLLSCLCNSVFFIAIKGQNRLQLLLIRFPPGVPVLEGSDIDIQDQLLNYLIKFGSYGSGRRFRSSSAARPETRKEIVESGYLL
jgi:hypothetical protein